MKRSPLKPKIPTYKNYYNSSIRLPSDTETHGKGVGDSVPLKHRKTSNLDNYSGLKTKTGLKRTPLKQISKKKSRQISKECKIWQQILVRCQGFCEYCGKNPDFRGLHPHEMTFRSHGGELTLENTKASCGSCHSLKHGIYGV